jgi:hypothetical protein
MVVKKPGLASGHVSWLLTVLLLLPAVQLLR